MKARRVVMNVAVGSNGLTVTERIFSFEGARRACNNTRWTELARGGRP